MKSGHLFIKVASMHGKHLITIIFIPLIPLKVADICKSFRINGARKTVEINWNRNRIKV